jgi:23S rRNA pseudouridine2605 synthase/16S rRNA pseudouridine516 synthase
VVSDEQDADRGERLQKVMAAAGIASRRVCEDLISAGRVEVNGEIVEEPGRRVVPGDRVSVDGMPIQLDVTKRYVVLNKPTGVVSTMRDEHGRPDLSAYTGDYEERLYNVGRLDYETSGLLLLTNDGDLAHVLAHPSFGVEKTYLAKVAGIVTAKTIEQLKAGVELDDGPIAADRVRVTGTAPRDGLDGTSMVELTLHSGRNRIVRRMLDAVGHPVIQLVRRQFGPITLGSLGLGRTRTLTRDEIGRLLELAQQPTGSASTVDRRRPPARPGGRQKRYDR